MCLYVTELGQLGGIVGVQIGRSFNVVTARSPRAGLGPGKNVFRTPFPPSKGGPAKSLYTKSETLSLIFRVTWAWSERVN